MAMIIWLDELLWSKRNSNLETSEGRRDLLQRQEMQTNVQFAPCNMGLVVSVYVMAEYIYDISETK